MASLTLGELGDATDAAPIKPPGRARTVLRHRTKDGPLNQAFVMRPFTEKIHVSIRLLVTLDFRL